MPMPDLSSWQEAKILTPDYLFIDISALAYYFLTPQSKFNDTSSHIWTCRVSLTASNPGVQGVFTPPAVRTGRVSFHHKQ
jgi:hypothetical protein